MCVSSSDRWNWTRIEEANKTSRSSNRSSSVDRIRARFVASAHHPAPVPILRSEQVFQELECFPRRRCLDAQPLAKGGKGSLQQPVELHKERHLLSQKPILEKVLHWFEHLHEPPLKLNILDLYCLGSNQGYLGRNPQNLEMLQ